MCIYKWYKTFVHLHNPSALRVIKFSFPLNGFCAKTKEPDYPIIYPYLWGRKDVFLPFQRA